MTPLVTVTISVHLDALGAGAAAQPPVSVSAQTVAPGLAGPDIPPPEAGAAPPVGDWEIPPPPDFPVELGAAAAPEEELPPPPD